MTKRFTRDEITTLQCSYEGCELFAQGFYYPSNISEMVNLEDPKYAFVWDVFSILKQRQKDIDRLCGFLDCALEVCDKEGYDEIVNPAKKLLEEIRG